MRPLALGLLVLGACASAVGAPPTTGKVAGERSVGPLIDGGDGSEAREAASDGGVGSNTGDRDDRGSVDDADSASSHASDSEVSLVAPSQPLWLDSRRTDLTGCSYADGDVWRENPNACRCLAVDGGVALDCPRMTPHPGIRGCIWTGVPTHFRKGSMRVGGDGVECTCAGDDEKARWTCHRARRVHPL